MRVERVSIALAVSLLACGILLAQGPRRDVGANVPLPAPAPSIGDSLPTGQKAISIDVELVSLDVVVTDKNGAPIQGLEKRHFKVFDNNVEQTITNFTPTDAPMTVVVLIEFGQTFGAQYDNVLVPAAGFINSLRPDDWAALVSYDVRPEILTDFTKDKNQLLQALSRLRFPTFRETALFDAVYDSLKRMEKVEGKKAIFLLSTGFNSIGQRTQGEVLKKAEASDTMIYAAGLGQFARLYYQSQIGLSDSVEFLQADNNIRSLAEATGGVAFYPRFPNEYTGIFDTISKEMRNQYSIGFVPKNLKNDGKLHKLRVEVAKLDVNKDGKPVGFTVRHKKGYYSPTETPGGR